MMQLILAAAARPRRTSSVLRVSSDSRLSGQLSGGRSNKTLLRSCSAAMTCALGTLLVMADATHSTDFSPRRSFVSGARSGDERMVRPIVGSTTAKSARAWMTFEAQPYARERTRSISNPTRRALNVSSRCLLDTTIEARWWRFYLLVARVTARREAGAVGTVGDHAVLPGSGRRGGLVGALDAVSGKLLRRAPWLRPVIVNTAAERGEQHGRDGEPVSQALAPRHSVG